MDADFVIMAVGAKPEKEIITKSGLEINDKAYVKINENYKTNYDGVFAGGDLVGEKATVAWASRSGREAAKAIMEWLKGLPQFL